MSNTKETIIHEIYDRYRRKTPNSEKEFKISKQWFMGGATRNISYFKPYPFFVTHGAGQYLYDVDGNELIDCSNNMTSLIHGHAHPHVVEAIKNQVDLGTVHGPSHVLQYQLAKILCERVPSVKAMRFCNSGTESTLFTLRAARGFTKQNKIIKIDGGYHGAHDYVEVNITPDFKAHGLPTARVEPAIPPSVLNDVLIAPFNDLESMELLVNQNKNEVAAIIIEPILTSMGAIPPDLEVMKGIRELADDHGIILIFDEIITFRFHEGGYQSVLGIQPDLTAFGKIIGGGLPVGAIGGRQDILEIFNPEKRGSIVHSGTFTGNALTMAAGIATLELYRQKDINYLNDLGDRLRKGFKDTFDSQNILGSVGGVGSIVIVNFHNKSVKNAKEAMIAYLPFMKAVNTMNVSLINHGLYSITKIFFAFVLSTPMTTITINEIIEKFSKSLIIMKPLLNSYHG